MGYRGLYGRLLEGKGNKIFTTDFNGKTIAQMLAEKNVSVNSAYTGLAIGIFNCIVGAFLSYYLYLFFKKHSDRGVIIDKPLVKETRKVSLVYIIVSLSAAVLSGIGIGIARAFDKSIHVNNALAGSIYRNHYT